MRHFVPGTLVIAAFGAALAVMTAVPASAQLARPQLGIVASSGNSDLVNTVQYRGYGHRGWRHGRHRHRGGIGIGAGLAAGAIIGGALAARPYYATPYQSRGAIEYCMSRFKSYDPASGTYLGYDGYRHSCP